MFKKKQIFPKEKNLEEKTRKKREKMNINEIQENNTYMLIICWCHDSSNVECTIYVLVWIPTQNKSIKGVLILNTSNNIKWQQIIITRDKVQCKYLEIQWWQQ